MAQLIKNLPAMQEILVRLLGWEDPLEKEGIGHPLQDSWAFPVAQLVKNLPAMWEIWVQSLGWGRVLLHFQCPQGSSVLQRVFEVFFLRLHDIPLCGYIILCLSVHTLMDI